MCEFHKSTCNGFGDIWWTDNPIYFSSIDFGFLDPGNIHMHAKINFLSIIFAEIWDIENLC